MAFYKVTKKQSGGGGTTMSISYLKWQITKTKSTPAGGYLQMSEFYLYLNGTRYSWDAGVSITSDMQGGTTEGIANLIDGNTSTKYCTSAWGSSQQNICNIVINLNDTITVDANTTYSYVTANDEPTRDPSSWALFGSSDGTNWNRLDYRDDYQPVTSRNAETSKFYLNIFNRSSDPNIVSDLIPRMTSDTEPSGECYANYVYSGRYAWYGFATTDCGQGGNARTFWYNNGGAANNYIQYDFKKIVTIYRVYFGSIENGTFTNRHIKFQVSSDGETWIDDKTITIDTWKWMPYDFISPKTCRYLRLVCTDAMEYAISGIQAQGYVGDTLPKTIILKGSTNPSSAQGSDGQLYLKYGLDNRYTYDATLGGYVLNAYYFSEAGQLLGTVGGRSYAKTNNGGAIAVIWKNSAYSGPLLISTVESNTYYTYNGSVMGSATIDGITWYLSTTEYWTNPVQAAVAPIVEADYYPTASYRLQDAIEAILEASDFKTTLSTEAITDSFAKVNGAWENLVGTDVNDITNATADTVSIYKGSTVPSSSLGADGNVYFQYGVLDAALLHFEDSATTDEFNNTTWTAEGTATISADQHKFGSKSLYLNGSGYLRSPVGDDMFNFGSGDFTISMWIYPLFASRYALFSMSYDCRIGSDIFQGKGSANMWMSSDGSWNVIQSDNDTATSGMGNIALNANEWTHIAYIRSGDTCKIFVNGQLAKATDVPSGTSVYWTGNDFFQIGRWAGGSYMFNGYIDELFVMKGTAYWDSDFTPPTQPFSVSDFTNVVVDTYAKDNGSWQSLKGTPIDDIAGTVEPT